MVSPPLSLFYFIFIFYRSFTLRIVGIMIKIKSIFLTIFLLDNAFWAQARFEGLRSPSADFMSRFLKCCAPQYPLLPKDLGATGLRAFRVDALASTAAKEKSAFHRLIDSVEFLQRFFANVSPFHNKILSFGKCSGPCHPIFSSLLVNACVCRFYCLLRIVH